MSSTPGTAGSAAIGGATSIGTGVATGSAGDGIGGAGGSVANPCPSGTNCATIATPPSKPPVPATDAGAAPPASPEVTPLPPTAVSVPQPVPTTGICEPKPIVCTSVTDCPSADFDCVMDVMPTIAAPCPADTKCPTPPPQIGTTGTCNPKVRACGAAADCPAPLVCQAEGATCSGGGSAGPDGIVTTTPDTCTPGPSVCTWAPVNCTTDADCADPLYQCVKVSESSFCTTSGGTGTCAPGVTCPVPEPPTCGTTVVMNCMPKPMNCACGPCPAGAMCGACLTCPAGWSCFDFSNYNGGVRPNWSPNAPDKSCLPDGIVFATQGHALDGGQFTANSGVTRGGTVASLDSASTGTGVKNGTSTDTSTGVVSGPSGNPTPPTVSPVAPTGAGNSSAAGGSTATPMTHSSGCAYGGSDTRTTSLWLALAMTGPIVRLARRRSRAR